MTRATRQRFSSSVFCAALLASIALCPTGTRAHDWYPMECCHHMDCAPVESAGYTTPVAGGDVPQLIVTTRHGSAVVPQDITLRESGDHRMHACMRREAFGRMRITCIFLPPSN